jgi:ATP-binding cassette subfamily E protein 1
MCQLVPLHAGIGKSTALKILSGKLKPNLGRFTAPPDW